MLFFYGIKGGKNTIIKINNLNCPVCKNNKSIELEIKQFFFHILSLPMFYITKDKDLICKNCYSQIKIHKLSKEDKKIINNEYKKVKISISNFYGTFIFTGIGLFLYMMSKIELSSTFGIYISGIFLNLFLGTILTIIGIKKYLSIKSKNLKHLGLKYDIIGCKYTTSFMYFPIWLIGKIIINLFFSIFSYVYLFLLIKELYILLNEIKHNDENDILKLISNNIYSREELIGLLKGKEDTLGINELNKINLHLQKNQSELDLFEFYYEQLLFGKISEVPISVFKDREIIKFITFVNKSTQLKNKLFNLNKQYENLDTTNNNSFQKDLINLKLDINDFINNGALNILGFNLNSIFLSKKAKKQIQEEFNELNTLLQNITILK